jgi:hypothetical protein
MYGTDTMSRRPRANKKSSAGAVADLSGLLAASGTTMQHASWHEASWFAKFKRRVDSAYVQLNKADMPKNPNPWESCVYSADECIAVMHNATPGQRDLALRFLDAHPDRTAYANMMRAFIATERNPKNPAFGNLLALYDVLGTYIVEKRPRLISDITGAFDFDVNAISDAALKSLRAELKVTAFCCNDAKGQRYLTTPRRGEMGYSHVFTTDGSPMLLCSDLQLLVTTLPDLADRVIAVIKNSEVRLSPDEIISIAKSGMNTSLMEGLL